MFANQFESKEYPNLNFSLLINLSNMSTHASGLNFVAFLRAEADAAEDKARRLRIQAAALTQTAGLGIGE